MRYDIDGLIELGQRVVDAALKQGATVAEAVVGEGQHLSAKVRLGEPELVEEAGSKSLGLRVMRDQQVAVTHTSDLSPTGLARVVEDALELARLSQADTFAGPPDPSLLSKTSEHVDLDLFDERVDAIDAAAALDMAKRAERAALSSDSRLKNSEGATVARQSGASALVTSGGFRAGSRGTYVSLVVSPVAEDEGGKRRTGYHWSARRHFAELDNPESVGLEAARRTLAKLGSRKIETQELPVVFDPDAARSIVGMLGGCVSGGSVWRRSTYLAERGEHPSRQRLGHDHRRPAAPARPRLSRLRRRGPALAPQRAGGAGHPEAAAARHVQRAQAQPPEHRQRLARRQRRRRSGQQQPVPGARHGDRRPAAGEHRARPLRHRHDGLRLQPRDRRLQPRCVRLLDREGPAGLSGQRGHRLAQPRRPPPSASTPSPASSRCAPPQQRRCSASPR